MELATLSVISQVRTGILAISARAGAYLSVRFDSAAVITSVHSVCVVTDGGHVV